MISNKIVAIDFGSTRITALAAEVLDSGEIKILSDESKTSDDVRAGIIEKPTGASFKVSEIVKLLKNSAKLNSITQLSVSVLAKSMKISSRTISRFLSEMQPVTDELLNELLTECEQKVGKQAGIKVFDIFPVAYFLDGEMMDDPVGKTAEQISANYNIVFGNEAIIYELERCIDRTGLLIESTPIGLEALSTALLDEDDRIKGCALINFGATATSLAVYHNDVLQNILVVPLGGKNITRDIMELGITEFNAERLKCLKGSALESKIIDPITIQIEAAEEGEQPLKVSTQFLSTIIESRLEEMLNPVFEILNLQPFDLEAGIIISGGGAKLNNMVDFIASHTQKQVRIGSHSEWLTEDTPSKYHDPIFSQLIGTVVLANEYRKEHPLKEETIENKKKKPKLPSIKDKLTEGIFNFFNSDNQLN